jgi:protein-tyrosine-phosphatase
LTPELVQSAEGIFCMEDFHRDIILSQMPEAGPKVYLLKVFQAKVPPVDPNIPDPIGKPKEVYESCLMTIKESVDRVAGWVMKLEKGSPG